MAEDSEQMLTTVDNPWNPWTNYSEWFEFDHEQGYDTPNLLARVANVSLNVSEFDFESELTEAMNEIVKLNVSGMHTLIGKPTTAS